MFRPELLHQLGHAPQLALRVISVESLAEPVGKLLGFELQQHAIKQQELLAVHALELLMQDGLELLRFDWRMRMAATHVGTIHSRNKADKTRRNAPHRNRVDITGNRCTLNSDVPFQRQR